ncbi:MAG: hypothetical protein N2651_04335 [Fimbriimonadales bacterium]|nr:hypothetical protein [Fimbriimonadales bacterium]
MVRGTLCVVGILLTLGASLAQPAVLGSDVLPQRRITVWLKLEPMRDALRLIGKQLGYEPYTLPPLKTSNSENP